MPIKEIGGEVIGVAQVINKIGTKDQRIDAFTDSDEKVRCTALFDSDGVRMYFSVVWWEDLEGAKQIFRYKH